jgi:hypothetical protein
MSLAAIQQYEFGGVDSRSNPLNMPTKRMLRCKNLVPQRDGHLALRYGYEEFVQSVINATAIHSLVGYQKLEGSRYMIFGQGTSLRVLDLATGTVTTPTVRGGAIASGSDWSWVFANNRLHGYNGTESKFFDGTVWRKTGVREPTAAEAAAVGVAGGALNANAVPQSTVGGAQPGYQFYIAYYNRQTGHVGNRRKIGGRMVPSAAREIDITSLPDLSGEDTELDILIGRTIDGAEVPYAVADVNGNWIYVPNGTTSATIDDAGIDPDAELPEENGLPQAFDKVALAGDRIAGNLANSPFVYLSSSETDAAATGIFVGRWEQSFKANRAETFPTGEALTCMAGYAQELWCFSQNDMAVLSDLSGVRGFLGPFKGGAAGKKAFVETPYGPFWLSGDKQLLTMTQGGPISASDEYERGLLKKIGDQYLSQVEVCYLRDVELGIDAIYIKGRDADGNTFRVVHDFSLDGQGYEDAYLGALASTYNMAVARDADGRLRMFGASTAGRLYTLFSGANDDGNEYTGTGLFLLNAGPDRPTISYLEWYGDSQVRWRVGKTLDTASDSLTDISGGIDGPSNHEIVPGGDRDFQYRVPLPEPECKYVYIEILLVSHSADGNLDLNDPPHCPLETYGRVYMVAPLMKGARGH